MMKVMDIMEDFLKSQNWQYLHLDGGTKTEEYASPVTLFNAKDSPYKIFILSTRASGLGLNFQTADTVTTNLNVVQHPPPYVLTSTTTERSRAAEHSACCCIAKDRR